MQRVLAAKLIDLMAGGVYVGVCCVCFFVRECVFGNVSMRVVVDTCALFAYEIV